jgi:very-short-patch-repair endonuclease
MTWDPPEPLAVAVVWQAGVVTRQQALGGGYTDHAITARLSSGRWQSMFHGVYATFSGEVPRRAWLWAAVLRAGSEALLSHETAAEEAGIIDGASRPIHVSVPREAGTLRIPGIALHHSSRVADAQAAARVPPQTSVEETVLDLADCAESAEDAVAWAIKACQRDRVQPREIAEAMNARRRLRWRGELEGVLADITEGVRSPLELRYQRRVERAHKLPVGERQVKVTRDGRRQYLDVRYTRFGVCVELDGAAFHPEETRARDMRRDNASALEGFWPLRYGWPEVSYHACEVAGEVGTLLRRGGWTQSPGPCGPDCLLAAVRTG